MPAACPCNHMFTAGISRNHNNRTSLPPSLIVCYSCRSLFGTGCPQGSSRVMIHFHTYILLCRISFFSGLRTRMPADRSYNRMFTAGINRNHDNRTSLPPSLIVCYSCRSLFGTGCPQVSSRVMIHFHTYIYYYVGFSFLAVCGPGCPRTVLVTACLLPASAGIMITVHRYLLL